jgi:ribosomal protein S6--L-glutamate ligase
LFVIDEVVASIQRETMPGEFKTNIHLGTASVINVTMEEKHSDKAAKLWI